MADVNADEWLAAAEEAGAGRARAVHSRPAPQVVDPEPEHQVVEAPWHIQSEPPATKRWRLALRGAVMLALVVLCVTGLRTLLTGDQSPEQPKTETASVGFPEAQGQAVAARFVYGYLTYDDTTEAAQDARAAMLAFDYGGGDDLGWDGTGVQTVRQVIPGAVTVRDSTHAVVTVDALVVAGGKQQSQSAWRSLQVPVAMSGDRVVVTGRPGYVAQAPATLASAAATDSGEVDPTLTQDTRDVAESFFRAFAAGDVSAVIAPDAPIVAPPAGTIEYEAIAEWQVFAAAPGRSDRTARAVVRWRDPVTGAQLDQEYSLTLTQVTSATGQRWQLNALSGGF